MGSKQLEARLRVRSTFTAFIESPDEAKRVAAALNGAGWDAAYSAHGVPYKLRAHKPSAKLTTFTRALMDCNAQYLGGL